MRLNELYVKSIPLKLKPDTRHVTLGIQESDGDAGGVRNAESQRNAKLECFTTKIWPEIGPQGVGGHRKEL